MNIAKTIKNTLTTIALASSLYASADFRYIMEIKADITVTASQVEQAVQSRQYLSNIGLTSTVNGITFDPMVTTELEGYNVNEVLTSSSSSQFFDNMNSASSTPIKSITVVTTAQPFELIVRYEGTTTAPELMTVSPDVSVSALSNEETHLIYLGGNSPIVEDMAVDIGGTTIYLTNGMTDDQVGLEIVASESNIKTTNPDVSSVSYDDSANQLIITYIEKENNSDLNVSYNPNVGGMASNPLWTSYTIQ
jgi:hypothetical protein